MRSIIVWSVLLQCMLWMFVGCSTENNNTQDVEAVRKVICIDYVTAVNSQDAVAYSKLFTDDLYWASPNSQVCRNKDDIISSLEQKFEQFIFHLEPTPPVEIQVFGTFSYCLAEAAVTLKPKDGSPKISLQARAIWLLKKQSAEWKIFRQVYNFSEP